jgi:hydrogenase maturation factor
MRDLTRGGLAAVLNCACSNDGIWHYVYEESVPFQEPVRGCGEIHGFTLSPRQEGRLLVVAPLKRLPYCGK